MGTVEERPPSTARLVRASLRLGLAGTSARPWLWAGLQIGIYALILLAAPRYEYWGQSAWFLVYIVAVPALRAANSSYGLRWPARVTLFAGLAGTVIGLVSVVGYAAFSQLFGADRGHSIIESLVLHPITLPIDANLFAVMLGVIAVVIVVLAWPGARSRQRAEHGRVVAWAASQGLLLDTSE